MSSVFQFIAAAVAIFSLVTGAGAVWKPLKSVQNILEFFGINQPGAESLSAVEIESIHDLVPYSRHYSGTAIILKSKPSAEELKMFLEQFQQWRIEGLETMQKLEKIVKDLDGREYVKNICENIAAELELIAFSSTVLPMILPIPPLATVTLVAGSMALATELGTAGYILVKDYLDKLSIEDAKTEYKNHVDATNRMLLRLLTLNLNIDQQYDFLDDKAAEFDEKSVWSYLKLVFSIALDARALHQEFISTGAIGAKRAAETVGVENVISFFDNLDTIYEIFDPFTSGSQEMNSEKILQIKMQLEEHFKHMQILKVIIEEAIHGKKVAVHGMQNSDFQQK